MRSFALALATALSLPMAAAGAPSDVTTVTRSMLDAYAAGDERAVLAHVADDVRVYGSDVADTATGKTAFASMLARDRRLWGPGATIGPMRHLSVVRGGDLATLFFDAPFQIKGAPATIVRFAMVWRDGPGGWRLLQSTNVVPTTGQSAQELLRHRE